MMPDLKYLLLIFLVVKVRADPEFVPNGNFRVVGKTASKLTDGCWRTIEIGSWFDFGKRHATVTLDSVSTDESPGVSVALGVLFEAVEGRVNDGRLSTERCGGTVNQDFDWSVRYGHEEGREYLGNRFGRYGPRLHNGDVVQMLIDLGHGHPTLAFAINGVCYGVMWLAHSNSKRFCLAAALHRADTITLQDTSLDDFPSCIHERNQTLEAFDIEHDGGNQLQIGVFLILPLVLVTLPLDCLHH
mmetsp:Transcript_48711/g.113717  ORF Transcript_48711/g.113717 Transcript_48711/m.113717 type:complete len:244 (-) Transcript_48711:355-1086(-)